MVPYPECYYQISYSFSKFDDCFFRTYMFFEVWMGFPPAIVIFSKGNLWIFLFEHKRRILNIIDRPDVKTGLQVNTCRNAPYNATHLDEEVSNILTCSIFTYYHTNNFYSTNILCSKDEKKNSPDLMVYF